MSTWKLQGITASRGQCDHCGRTLARLFRVVAPTGAEMVVGRICSAKLTGYSWSVAQAERIEARKAAERGALAEFGNLYAEAVMLAESSICSVAGPAGEASIGLRDGGIDADTAEFWLTKARRNLAAGRYVA